MYVCLTQWSLVKVGWWQPVRNYIKPSFKFSARVTDHSSRNVKNAIKLRQNQHNLNWMGLQLKLGSNIFISSFPGTSTSPDIPSCQYFRTPLEVTWLVKLNKQQYLKIIHNCNNDSFIIGSVSLYSKTLSCNCNDCFGQLGYEGQGPIHQHVIIDNLSLVILAVGSFPHFLVLWWLLLMIASQTLRAKCGHLLLPGAGTHKHNKIKSFHGNNAVNVRKKCSGHSIYIDFS